GADAVHVSGRQHDQERQRELQADPARSKTPRMRGLSVRENREVPWLPVLDGEAGRRGKAKANADQQNTLRTQRRASVPSALDRVREVARRDRKAKFTALFHHLTIDRL